MSSYSAGPMAPVPKITCCGVALMGHPPLGAGTAAVGLRSGARSSTTPSAATHSPQPVLAQEAAEVPHRKSRDGRGQYVALVEQVEEADDQPGHPEPTRKGRGCGG